MLVVIGEVKTNDKRQTVRFLLDDKTSIKVSCHFNLLFGLESCPVGVAIRKEKS